LDYLEIIFLQREKNETIPENSLSAASAAYISFLGNRPTRSFAQKVF
jgi:hypothetical protein